VNLKGWSRPNRSQLQQARYLNIKLFKDFLYPDNFFFSMGDIRFGNMFACLNSRLDYANMVAAYATLNKGLLCIGSGKSGSIRPGHFKYYHNPLMEEGNFFGDAWLQWWNDDGCGDMSWCSAMVMQGVGTLKLRPYDSSNVEINTHVTKNTVPQVRFKQAMSNISVYIPFTGRTTVTITDLLGRKECFFETNAADWHTVSAQLTPGIHIVNVTSQKNIGVYKLDVIR
jgi:hypothetical protein